MKQLHTASILNALDDYLDQFSRQLILVLYFKSHRPTLHAVALGYSQLDFELTMHINQFVFHLLLAVHFFNLITKFVLYLLDVSLSMNSVCSSTSISDDILVLILRFLYSSEKHWIQLVSR